MRTAPLRIGQVASEAGVGIETIRFYERLGLIPDPPRTPAGYRQYPIGVVARLRMIQHAKELGFSLKEIGNLLPLIADPNTTCDEVKGVVEAKLGEVRKKSADLARIQAALEDLIVACEQGNWEADPILTAIHQGEAGIPKNT